MPLLKFRVIYEDDDSIFRDIEIRPVQLIDDLQESIISAYSLPATNDGLFFMSNDNWQKGRQIHPIISKAVKKPGTKAKAEVLPSIVAFIDDPHQHFIYEYHGLHNVSFLIELISIGGTEQSSTIYPVIVRSQGSSPFKKEVFVQHASKNNIVVPAEEEEEEDEPSPFVGNDSEPDPDDLVSIEGEEGDLMEGDPVKEEAEEEEAPEDNFDESDDFENDELSDGGMQEMDEEL